MSGLKDTCGKIDELKYPKYMSSFQQASIFGKLIEHFDRSFFKCRKSVPVKRLVEFKYKGILVK